MSDVRLIDVNVVISYIDDCIAESREEREDAKSRGNDCEVNYNAGEIQMARRIKRQINLGTPTINAVPVAQGRLEGDHLDYKCSACGTAFHDDIFWIQGDCIAPKHCPECGARWTEVPNE